MVDIAPHRRMEELAYTLGKHCDKEQGAVCRYQSWGRGGEGEPMEVSLVSLGKELG